MFLWRESSFILISQKHQQAELDPRDIRIFRDNKLGNVTCNSTLRSLRITASWSAYLVCTVLILTILLTFRKTVIFLNNSLSSYIYCQHSQNWKIHRYKRIFDLSWPITHRTVQADEP